MDVYEVLQRALAAGVADASGYLTMNMRELKS
jgi:p-aminobenzoyl-glutamate transporter AbgT